MHDFVNFVSNESSQTKYPYDLYLSVDRNRTKVENVLQIEQDGVYNRSTVRKYLFEYLSKRLSWSRTTPTARDDACRYWFISRSLKEYLIMDGKMEYSY